MVWKKKAPVRQTIIDFVRNAVHCSLVDLKHVLKLPKGWGPVKAEVSSAGTNSFVIRVTGPDEGQVQYYQVTIKQWQSR